MRSNFVDQYILNQTGNTRVMMEILNDLFTSYEFEFTSSLKYGVPFYVSNKKTICYLHKCKDGSLDITFWNAKNLIIQFEELEQRNRKRMASLNYKHPEDLNLELIKQIAIATKINHG